MDEIQFRQATPQDDAISANHLIKIAQELGFSEAEIDPKFLSITLDWLAQARKSDCYQGFIAETNHQVIGSIEGQLFQKA